MLQRNAITEVPPDSPGFYSNVFLVNKASLSYVHYKLNSEYHQKRRLCVHNRSAGCIHSCTDPSRQQEVPTLCIREQSLSVLSTSLWSEHSLSDIYSFGHTVAAYLHPQGISIIPYLDNCLIPHPYRQGLLCHQSQLVKTLSLKLAKKNPSWT